MQTITVTYKDLMGYDMQWKSEKIATLWEQVLQMLPEEAKEMVEKIMWYEEQPYVMDFATGLEPDEDKVVPYKFSIKNAFNNDYLNQLQRYLDNIVILARWEY